MTLGHEVAAARQLIADARWIGVISHERPDGDAVGALLALSLALARAGKQVAPVLGDGLPGRYRFLPGSAELLREFPRGVDLLISVDCSDLDRLGVAPGQLPRSPDINIDHHPTNTRFAKINLVDEQASATAGLLVTLLQDFGLEIDSPVASNFLAGIVTDTIGFRVPGVSSTLPHAARERLPRDLVPELRQRPADEPAGLRLHGDLRAPVIFFAYFYTAIAFNPVDTADNLRKYGGFVPGIRPGPPTAYYLNYVLTRMTLPGSLYLAAIALLPSIVFAFWVIQQFPFGGTSLLITAGVALETMKQLESQLLMRHYEGFLK